MNNEKFRAINNRKIILHFKLVRQKLNILYFLDGNYKIYDLYN